MFVILEKGVRNLNSDVKLTSPRFFRTASIPHDEVHSSWVRLFVRYGRRGEYDWSVGSTVAWNQEREAICTRREMWHLQVKNSTPNATLATPEPLVYVRRVRNVSSRRMLGFRAGREREEHSRSSAKHFENILRAVWDHLSERGYFDKMKEV